MKPVCVVVSPTYNEAKNVETTISGLLMEFKKIPKYNLKVLIVDDTSPDGTGEIVKAIAKKNSAVKLLVNSRKGGLGKAYLVGLSYAFEEMGAEVAVQMDADGQHNPKDLKRILKKLDEGYDLVIGSRYIPGGGVPKKWGYFRKLMSSGGNFMARFVLGKWQIHEWTTSYRAIKREVFKKLLPRMRERKEFVGYAWMIGQMSLALDLGFVVGEVPIVFLERKHGDSKLSPEYVKNSILFLLKKRLGWI